MTSGNGRWIVSGLRLAVAALVLTAVVVQFIARTGTVANFFSFFTIQSNLIGVAAMIAAALASPAARRSVWLSQLRGAAALYMGITGIVYNTLLRGLEASLDTTLPWVNSVLHVVFPVVMVADWLLDRTVRPLSWRQGLVFLLYPIAYLVYTLIRGSIVDWYPYPFLDPRTNGYPYVLVMSLLVAVVALGLSWVVTWSSRWGAARRDDRAGVTAGR